MDAWTHLCCSPMQQVPKSHELFHFFFVAKTSVSIGLGIKNCSILLCFHQINTFLPNKHKKIVKKQFFGV